MIANDDAKHVVEIVRHAAGEIADRLHLLGLAKFLVNDVSRRHIADRRIPSVLSKGLSMSSIGNALPSLRFPISSSLMPICCASASAVDRVPSASRRSVKPCGMMFVTFCPTSSSLW